MDKIKSLVKLARPKHSIKNLLIFAPLLFSLSNINQQNFNNAGLGFLVFSLVASSIYIINDYKDIKKDQLHPKKQFRPLASGKITKTEAKIFFIFLISLAIAVSLLAKFSLISNALILLYFILNLSYSLGLKNIPVVDIVILASGFLLRLFYGSSLTDIKISSFMYLVVMSGAFYLGASKRYYEILKVGKNTRSVLKSYSEKYLKSIMDIALALIIIFYTQWCIESSGVHQDLFLFSVPMLIILIVSYMYVSEKDSTGDPTDTILNNKPLIIYSILFLGYLMYLIRL